MKKAIIKKHLLVLLAGFLLAMKGALCVALLVGVVVTFCSVQLVSGYLAVTMFAAALLEFATAVWLVYSCGRYLLRGKFEK